MKLNDLQIGDWVFFYAGFDKEESCNSPVSGILATNILYSKDDIFLEFCGGDPFHGDELYPIPLTGEILERSGFKPVPWTVQVWKGVFKPGIAVEVCKQDKWYCRFERDGGYILQNTPQYVHELQHNFNLFHMENKWNIEQRDNPDWDLINKEE